MPRARRSQAGPDGRASALRTSGRSSPSRARPLLEPSDDDGPTGAILRLTVRGDEPCAWQDVIVEEEADRPSREAQAVIERARLAAIRLCDRPELICRSIRSEELRRPVGRSVVHDDDLDVGACLAGQPKLEFGQQSLQATASPRRSG